jgi:hypothetical protein
MTATNKMVSVILGGHDCGNGYTADDLALLSAVFSMAAKTLREGGQGRVCCSEPGADSQGKLLAEVWIEDSGWNDSSQPVPALSLADAGHGIVSFTAHSIPEHGSIVSE